MTCPDELQRDGASTKDGSRLCVSCGMCCDGTLFAYAKAEADEAAKLDAYGLERLFVRGKPRFRLGCRHLSCGSCTIYEDRFTICRSFRCALLRRYDAGEISLEDAMETVETAKKLLANVLEQAPDAAHFSERESIRRRAAQWASAADLDTRRIEARLYLDIIALEQFLQSRFRSKAGEESALKS